MKTAKCKYCDKVVEGYTEKQVEYMLKQHVLARHIEHVKINGE